MDSPSATIIILLAGDEPLEFSVRNILDLPSRQPNWSGTSNVNQVQKAHNILIGQFLFY